MTTDGQVPLSDPERANQGPIAPRRSAQTEPTGRMVRPWPSVLAGGLLLAITLAAYAPAVRDGFIWDDDAYVTRNATLRSLDGLWRMWFVPYSLPQYYPLVHTTFWLEYHLWGLAPAGYHVVNVLLHGASAVLFWRLLLRLRVPGAWLAAALFVVHPAGVESVAWVTERKNVLSLALALGSLLAYLRFAPPEANVDNVASAPSAARLRWYGAALVLFLAALLSKTVVASLPAVLLVICWWKRGRVTWQDVVPLVPFFVAGAGLGLYTVWLETTHVGAAGAAWSFTPFERVLIAGRAVWFYAGKLAVPSPLIFFYPRWEIDDRVWWQYLYPLAALTLLVGLWLARGRIGRGPLAALLIFVGVLTPALGFFNVYPFRYSFVADHFQYHASLALIALAAAGGALLARRSGADARSLARFLAAATLITLVVLTFRRTFVYQDPQTLYGDTIARNPASVIAHANLALYLSDRGQQDEALKLAREGVRLDPREPAAQNNLGLVLLRIGDRFGSQPSQLEEAVTHLNECLRLDPKYTSAHSNLAYMSITRGKPDDALRHFSAMLEIEPGNARALFGMGTCLDLLGRRAESPAFYERSIERDPGLMEARHALARSLVEQGRVDEAIRQLEAALRVDQNSVEGHYLLGAALSQRGDVEGAARHYAVVVRLRPDYVAAIVNLGFALLSSRQSDEAMRCFQEALRRQPENADARYGLATALARQGRSAEAQEQFQAVLQLAPDNAAAHYELGNLLVAGGELRGAVGHYDEAVRLQPNYFEAWLRLGDAELKSGDVGEAVSHFREALRLRPDDAQARANLEQARQQQGQAKDR